MGQIHNRLQHLLVGADAHLIQHKRQRDRQWEEKNQIQQINRHRVAEELQKIGVGEKALKMLQPHPFALEQTLIR
ncbi:hypothetical protein D3C87_1863740 [compost metagenome]